ncbi:hypothetical protein Y1Q_0015720 [Alligator mississippiensis]|uniref:CCHC-type domain-containing protein n=1 Tax=Alligator mississippiensis TaxID=8496 RepID=A0A151NNU0_ALLMI|nr:hypothetical protein Y1Q_0015720 [Alligator mississippiensis]
MMGEDDVEAYLEAFEQEVTAAKWDPGSWATKLGRLLIGPAQAAYRALSRAVARDYKKVKAAILHRLDISPETYQHKFRAKKGPKYSRPQLLVQTLRDLTERWLQPEEHTTQEVIDRIILEQFLIDLMGSAQRWVQHHQPKMVEEALHLVEDNTAVEGEGEAPERERQWTNFHPYSGNLRSPPRGAGTARKEGCAEGYQEVVCYRCREKGHISWFCPRATRDSTPMVERHDEKMDCSFGRHQGPGHKNKPIVEVHIGNTIIPSIIDTGCSQSMVHSDLVPPHLGSLGTPVSMVCMHGAVYTYPRRKLELLVLGQTEEILVGLTKMLPCPMLLGLDWPHREEVVHQQMTDGPGAKERRPHILCFGDEEGELDIDKMIEGRNFHQEQ